MLLLTDRPGGESSAYQQVETLLYANRAQLVSVAPPVNCSLLSFCDLCLTFCCDWVPEGEFWAPAEGGETGENRAGAEGGGSRGR